MVAPWLVEAPLK